MRHLPLITVDLGGGLVAYRQAHPAEAQFFAFGVDGAGRITRGATSIPHRASAQNHGDIHAPERSNANNGSFVQQLTCKEVPSKNSSPMNTSRHSVFAGEIHPDSIHSRGEEARR